jgi:thiol-disulfide isomerase/thioredoxin
MHPPFPSARIFLLALLLVSCSPSLQPFQLPEGIAFKDFTSGQLYDSGSLRGKLLLVNFWAAWSPASIKELPELAALAKAFGPRGLVTMGVCLDDAQPSELLVFAERQGVRYPLVWPGDNLLDAIAPLETIPYTVLIDNEGKILARFRGPFKPGDLREAVEKNL